MVKKGDFVNKLLEPTLKKNRLELQDGSKTTNYNHMNFQNLIWWLVEKWC
jgi:hypothetical protein